MRRNRSKAEGIDDVENASLLSVLLTTIHQACREMEKR
jgi:DNA-binding LacI/PurR family transcriptional regulator